MASLLRSISIAQSFVFIDGVDDFELRLTESDVTIMGPKYASMSAAVRKRLGVRDGCDLRRRTRFFDVVVIPDASMVDFCSKIVLGSFSFVVIFRNNDVDEVRRWVMMSNAFLLFLRLK